MGCSKRPRCLHLAAALLAALAGLGSAHGAFAQNTAADTAPQVWLNAGAHSHHFNRDRDFRKNNTGFGAEVWLGEDHALMAGTFMNSDDARSHYAAYQWRPLHWEPAGVRIGAGVSLGAFDGYPRYRNGAWFPAALPVVSVEYKRIGVNFFFVPTISDRTDGAISIQLKLRVW